MTFFESNIDKACKELSHDTQTLIQFVRRNPSYPGCHGSITIDRIGEATRTIAEATRSKTKGVWNMDEDNVISKMIMQGWIK